MSAAGKKLDIKRIREFLRETGVESLEVSSETQKAEEKYEDSDNCLWVDEKQEDGTFQKKCRHRKGKKCDRGECVRIRIKARQADGTIRIVNYCDCSDWPPAR